MFQRMCPTTGTRIKSDGAVPIILNMTNRGKTKVGVMRGKAGSAEFL